jgi:hypothetical protein
MASSNYEVEAARVIKKRLDELRRLSYAEVQALSEAEGGGDRYCWYKGKPHRVPPGGPYQLEGRTLVTVLVARERWFGMTAYHIERGLVFSPDGTIREATTLELQNSGG